MQSSTNACRFDGTPGVALRMTSHMNPKQSTPRTIVTVIVSQCTVQKPPSVPRSGFARYVRWCSMYSDGVSAVGVASAIDLPPGFRHEDRRAEYDHCHRESAEERGVDDVGIGLQDEHESGDDNDEFAGFGFEHRDERASGPCRLAVAEREPEDHGERETRGEAHRAAERRRPRAVPSRPRPGDERDRGGDKRLPQEHGAQRPGDEGRAHEACKNCNVIAEKNLEII